MALDTVTLPADPGMLGTSELLGFLLVIFVLWIVLKVARVAIRLIFLFVTIAIILGALYWLFAR